MGLPIGCWHSLIFLTRWVIFSGERPHAKVWPGPIVVTVPAISESWRCKPIIQPSPKRGFIFSLVHSDSPRTSSAHRAKPARWLLQTLNPTKIKSRIMVASPIPLLSSDRHRWARISHRYHHLGLVRLLNSGIPPSPDNQECNSNPDAQIHIAH